MKMNESPPVEITVFHDYLNISTDVVVSREMKKNHIHPCLSDKLSLHVLKKKRTYYNMALFVHP